MASTTALFTALSGLNANARALDVIGNNIANVNTTAFKSSRVNFATVMSQTFSQGAGPNADLGGTNPYQVGLGTRISGTQRSFLPGSVTATGSPRDLAIDGDGFFVVGRGNDLFYTRAGNFQQNAANELVTVTGERLLGYGVDDNFRIVAGSLRPIAPPVGSLTVAEATRNVHMSGNLNAAGDVASQGASIRLLGTRTEGLIAITTANPPPGPGNRIAATTRLVDLEDPQLPGSNTPLFSAGQSIELRGAEKGMKIVPTRLLPISATTTISDLQAFLTGALNLNTSQPNPDGPTPGVALDSASGTLTIIGNTGRANDLAVESTDLRLLSAAGEYLRPAFTAIKDAAADGESVRTTFIAFDSLGVPVEVDLALTLIGKSNAGTRWRFDGESPDSLGPDGRIGSGEIAFDTSGRLVTNAPADLVISREGSGAFSPLQFQVFFAAGGDVVTALADSGSALAASYRDGSPIGTLSAYGVGGDGTITGTFTNGLTRTLGQVALARFNNNQGLQDAGANMFRESPNSGTAQITVPGTLGAGQLIAGALELSNVDISEEFIKMMLASTGFSASSRVIRTADELMQQLLVVGR